MSDDNGNNAGPRPKFDSVAEAMALEMEDATQRWEKERTREIEEESLRIAQSHRGLTETQHEAAIERKFPHGSVFEDIVKKSLVNIQDTLVVIEPQARRALAQSNRALRENSILRNDMAGVYESVKRAMKGNETSSNALVTTINTLQTTVTRLEKREVRRDTRISPITVPGLGALCIIIAGMYLKIDEKVIAGLAGAFALLCYELVKRVGSNKDSKEEKASEEKKE